MVCRYRQTPANENATSRRAARRQRRRESTPEQAARSQAVLGYKFGRGYLLAVFVLRLEDLDSASLSGHEETRGADFGNLTDLAFYRAESAEHMLAAVEDLQFLSVQSSPRAGGGITAAYEVVDEIDVARPIDFRLGGAAPAFVARAGFVLNRFAVLAGHHQVGGLEHRRDPHREQAIEINAAERVIRAERRLLLQDHGAFVQSVGRPEDREAGLGVAAYDRPIDRAGAPVFRQERRVVLDRALLRDPHELLRRELQHESHDADVGVERAHRIECFLVAQRLELEDLEAFFLRRRLERIGLRSLLLGRAEHAGDLVAAGEKRFENGFAEVLLSDDRDSHQAAFLGGTEKAPAFLSELIRAWS